VGKEHTARQRESEEPAAREARSSETPALPPQAGAAQLDRLVHERIRLGILSGLAVSSTLCFSELKGLLKTSDGNLSVHARKLEDAGYIDCSKTFDGRFPRTEYRLTAKGRRALQRYLDHMEALIRATREK